MKKRKVISSSNFPIKAPVYLGAILYLLLDKFNAVQWVWGVLATIYAIIVIIWIVDTLNTESVDIFDKDKK